MNDVSFKQGFVCGLIGTGAARSGDNAVENLTQTASSVALVDSFDPNTFTQGYLVGTRVREYRLSMLRQARREALLKLADKYIYLATSDGYVLTIGNSHIRVRGYNG